MNISASNNTYTTKQVNVPIALKQVVQYRGGVAKRDASYFAAQELKKAQNQSTLNNNDTALDKQTSRQAAVRAGSTRNINPNLLDKVFKLKSKEERAEINSNRRSDLYLRTEIIASSNATGLGIGLDLYV